METPQQTLTLDESVAQVMQTLPLPIRQYLSQGKYTMVAKGLMSKYSLRIDQGGVLEREIMLLLMGIENPDEFAASLKSDAALSEDTVRSIMTDINQEIFIPLQKEMREARTGESNMVSSAPAPVLPHVNAPAQSQPPPTLRAPISSVTAPLPPKMTMPDQNSAPAPRQAFTPEQEQRARLLNIAPRASASPTADAPVPLPLRTTPATQTPPGASRIERPAPPPLSQPVAPAKPYSTAPYREPIE